jgi:uncharacterized membrane protein YqaE (UPF0057 family)
MRRIKLLLAVMVLSVGLFSCSTSRTDFQKVKYLDRSVSKNMQAGKVNKVKPTNDQQEVILAETEVYTGNELAEVSPVSKNDFFVESKPVVKPSPFAKSQKQANEILADKPAISMEEVYNELKSQRLISNGVNEIKEGKVVGTLVKVILSFILPPLAVFLHVGMGTPFWISLLLTLLLWVPGVIYSLLVVLDVI